MKNFRLVRNALHDYNTNEKRSDQLAQSIHPELAVDFADSFAEHARQATVIRDQNHRVELLRGRLKKLRQCCRDIVPMAERICERLGNRWSESMIKCLRWLRNDYKSTSPLTDSSASIAEPHPTSAYSDNASSAVICVADNESTCDGDLSVSIVCDGPPPTQDASNQEILAYLMSAAETINRRLMGEQLECLLNNSMQNLFDSQLTDLIKGPVRSARLQSEEFLALYSTYQDQLRSLNSLVSSVAAERRKTSKNPHAKAFPLRPAEQKRYSRVRNELSQTDQLLEASAQLAFQKFQLVAENVETDSLPLTFISYLKTIKSFFRDGLALCEQLLPDETAQQLETTLADRKQEFQEARQFCQPFKPTSPALRQSFCSSNLTSAARRLPDDTPPSPPRTPLPSSAGDASCGVVDNCQTPPPPLTAKSRDSSELQPFPPSPSDRREDVPHNISTKLDPDVVIPSPQLIQATIGDKHAGLVRLLTDPEMHLLRCLISGGSEWSPQRPPAYLPPAAYRHVNSMLKVLEISGCLSRVMSNLVRRRNAGYFNHQHLLFHPAAAQWRFPVPLIESILNPLADAMAKSQGSDKIVAPNSDQDNYCNARDEEDGDWWLDRLIVKQFFTVYARSFLQKTVGALIDELNTTGGAVTAAAQASNADDDFRQQTIELTQRLLRSIVHHRGLLPRPIRELCRFISSELPVQLLRQTGDEHAPGSRLIRTVTTKSGNVWCGDEEQSVGEMLLLVFLLYDFILPALRYPENWGLPTPAEQGAISKQVILSHSSPAASQSPSKRGTVIISSSPTKSFRPRLEAVALLVDDLAGLFMGIERESILLDDVLVVHTLYEEFERPLRDLLRWVSSARPASTTSHNANTAVAAADSSRDGTADGLGQWMLRDELNCLADDYLATCWAHLQPPAYPQLIGDHAALIKDYREAKRSQQQQAEARLSAATANQPSNSRRATTTGGNSRKSVLIRWNNNSFIGSLTGRNANGDSSDSD